MGDIDGLYIEGEYQYEGLTLGKTVPREQLDKLKGFKFREDDILMASYLKAGNVIIFMKKITQKLCKQRQTHLSRVFNNLFFVHIGNQL